MKKLVIAIFCLLLMAIGSFPQTGKTPVKTSPISTIPPAVPITEIPENEWNEIVKSFETEDWNKTSLLASLSLKKITIENEQKQLA